MDAVLCTIAAIHGGLVADWMAVLDWGASIALNSSLPAASTRSIPDLLREIAQRGAPFLFGFDEKYDDPWEPYVHLALTAKGLAEGLTPSRALLRATARLRNLSKAETLDLLNLVPDPSVRATAVQRIAAAPAAGMFSEPYLNAGFEIYGLV